jgi:predicted acetyltransferase
MTTPASADQPQLRAAPPPVPRGAYEVRTATEDDWDAIWRIDGHAFSFHASEEIRAAERRTFEFDRTILAWDRGEAVGVAGAYSLTMTLAGGPQPVAGVTWVGVLPTHRRRGVLTALMGHQLHALHRNHEAGDEDGEAVAALWASEMAIYGRFGYGAASQHLSLTIPRGARALTPPALAMADVAAVRLRYVDAEESVALVQPVYEAMAAGRSGVPARNDAWRQRAVFDPESQRGGATPLRCIVAQDASGAVRGYARFTTKEEWDESGPKGTVRVREAEALDPETYVSLWRFLLDYDLTASVVVRNRPLDDPLTHLLSDVRGARPLLRDGLFVRLVDVDRALSQRAYSAAVDVVLDVTDPFCPWNAGRFRLEGDVDGARYTRTDAAADLALSASELGAVYLGGTTLVELARAGRVHEQRQGSLAAASRAFRGDAAPWCPFVF